MTRFYFHIVHNGARLDDLEGEDFHNLAAAQSDALAAAREMAADAMTHGRPTVGGIIEIADAGGAVLSIVPFSSA